MCNGIIKNNASAILQVSRGAALTCLGGYDVNKNTTAHIRCQLAFSFAAAYRKTCFKCGQEKDIGEFYAHPQMADGHLNKCKECTKADAKKNYRNNLSTRRAYDATRNKRDNRKAQRYRSTVNLRAKYPEKNKARQAVARALASGVLLRLDCEHCGNPKSEAHHPNYSKPLDVVWLCLPCHRAEHGIYVLSTEERITA